MAVSDDVFRSILAMDSYNRGSNAGVGNIQSGLPGTQIGNATIGQSLGVQNLSFFAQAYSWNGETIISYRGTDSQPLDWIAGWVTGGGSPASARAPADLPNRVASSMLASHAQHEI